MFNDMRRRAGRTGLIDLAIPGQAGVSAFIHSLQRPPGHPRDHTRRFSGRRPENRVTVDVPVHIVGESDLVRGGDALLNQVLTTLQVRALPTDILVDRG
ncbi:MAG: hypothetical protein U0Z44_20700 [Kouleothrix sp.]